MTSPQRAGHNRSRSQMLRAAYGAFAASALFSFAVNLLMLTLPLFMFQVFDRVWPRRNHISFCY